MTAARIVPPARPEMTRDFAAALAGAAGILAATVCLVGRRAYYRDTMGRPGVNDRGIYDDAIALLAPTSFQTFNANCDPSLGRPGIAVLLPGVWSYKLGIHGLTKPRATQYEALVQAAEVAVVRDGGPDHHAWTETGWLGINIHRGGYTTTSSLGCQTIYPDQWPDFIGSVRAALHAAGQTIIPYVLTDRGAA